MHNQGGQPDWSLRLDDLVVVNWHDGTQTGPARLKHTPTAVEPFWIVLDELGNPLYFVDFKYISRCHPAWHASV